MNFRRTTLGDHGGALLLWGEPGIGKTALMDCLGRYADRLGVQCLRTAGRLSESHLAFAGLHELVRPHLGDLSGLPAPRRRALLAAFGLEDAAAPEPFLIGLAVLDLLAELATDRPVLLIVDDAHWLDRETLEVLAFIARRLRADPVLLIVTARPGFVNALIAAVADTVVVRPLDDTAARVVLDTSQPSVPADRYERVLSWAAGNPLALVELPLALESRPDLPTDPPVSTIPMTARLKRTFATRALDLPAAARAILLIATVNDTTDVAEAVTAATAMSAAIVEVADLEPAVDAGLVCLDGGQVVFRHALVEAAVYGESSGEDRRRAHTALADTLVAYPDRRVWHRAYAGVLPDAELADSLEEIARRAQRRGGLSVALAAQRRAIALTDDVEVRARRLLAGAELAFDQGDRDLVEQLVREVQSMDIGLLDHSRADYLSDAFDFRPWTKETILGVIARAAEVGKAGDPELACRFLASAVARSYLAAPDEAILAQVALAVDRLGLPEDHTAVLTLYAFAAPVERGALVLDRIRHAVPGAGTDHVRLFRLAVAAGQVGDVHGQLAAVVPAIAGLRRQGRMFTAVQALWVQATATWFSGDWDAGLVAAAEAVDLGLETSQPLCTAASRLAESHLRSVRGDLPRAVELLTQTLQASPAFAPAQIERARGLLDLAGERYGDAYDHLVKLFTAGEPAYHFANRVLVVADLAEAATGAGRRGDAVQLLKDVEQDAARTPSPLLHAGLAFARAVLAPDEDAEALFRQAVDPAYAAWPFLWARSHLAYGSWLRRHRQVSGSRDLLRAARDQFDRLGAEPWSQRARRELRAAGEVSEPAVAGPATGLSPQELQIAMLAAEGLTNRQIGDRLFMSHRTVATYLYQAFPKLGVSARGQIAAALGKD